MPWTTLPKPIIALAPMVDVTDSAFRQICKTISIPEADGVIEVGQTGADVTFSEMVVADAAIHALDHLRPRLTATLLERPYVIQLTGNSLDKVIAAAKLVVTEFQPDGIDLNMGCPAKTAIKNRYGAMLIEQSELAVDIVRALKATVQVPVSAKIRRLKSADTDSTVLFCQALAAAGVDLITVHGRTRHEHYETQADWPLVNAVAAAVNVPVLGSGDLTTPEQIMHFLATTRASGVLVARGAIGNPWIFPATKLAVKTGQLLPPVSWATRKPVIRQHAQLTEALFGQTAILPFRHQLAKYVTDFPGSKQLRERAVRLTSFQALYTLLDEEFDPAAAE